ncbi:MAG: isocitrate lyase/PEP mutase family protein [Hyphomicrobiaceae bacterium]|nr:isocitrate lyase/PEP mutase family protein [Hyphomicrobiaceae bacterium]
MLAGSDAMERPTGRRVSGSDASTETIPMPISKAARLRQLLAAKTFLHMPSVYDGLGARLVQQAGFEAVYCGGYVSGASSAVSEPLLTMTEQIAIAAGAARVVDLPLVADAGAGWGDPLHTMRTVREFIQAGIAGIHIEDQVYPKRAHYHTYQVHEIPPEEFAEKIGYACRERDRLDPDFVVIARTDSCREFGLDVAADRINRAADAGADLGLLFPRSLEEAERAPKVCRVPLVYVMSRGNRDGRPIFSSQDLRSLGYAAIIEAQLMLLPAFEAQKRALAELRSTGNYTGLSNDDAVRIRKEIEDTIGLEEFYEIERQTVERR